MQKKTAALPADLKYQNYEHVLSAMGARKMFTIAELSAMTHISRQTVTKAVEHFLAKKVIVPLGKGSSTAMGGKRPEQYCLNGSRYIICVATHDRKSTYSLISFAYEKVDEIEASGHMPDFTLEGFLSDISKKCGLLLRRNHIPKESFDGVIFCAGGIIDSARGVIRFSSSSPRWGRDVQIRTKLQQVFGDGVHVCVENVAKVCTSTMLFRNEARGRRVAVFYFDYGVAVTFLEDGRIAVGRNNVNGELGHMMLDPHDEEVCGCGARGCFEVLIGEKRVCRLLGELPAAQRRQLMEGYDGKEDIRVFAMKRCEEGSEPAQAIVRYMAGVFGSALRNVILAFDPDLVLLQGSMARCSDTFLHLAEEKVRENKYLSEGFELDIRRSSRSLIELQEEGGVNIMLKSFLGDAQYGRADASENE